MNNNIQTLFIFSSLQFCFIQLCPHFLEVSSRHPFPVQQSLDIERFCLYFFLLFSPTHYPGVYPHSCAFNRAQYFCSDLRSCLDTVNIDYFPLSFERTDFPFHFLMQLVYFPSLARFQCNCALSIFASRHYMHQHPTALHRHEVSPIRAFTLNFVAHLFIRIVSFGHVYLQSVFLLP